MSSKWLKKYKDARAETKKWKELADLSSKTQGIGMKMPKGLGFKKSGGRITYKMSGGQVVSHGYE